MAERVDRPPAGIVERTRRSARPGTSGSRSPGRPGPGTRSSRRRGPTVVGPIDGFERGTGPLAASRHAARCPASRRGQRRSRPGRCPIRGHDIALKTVTRLAVAGRVDRGAEVVEGAVEDRRAELDRLAPAAEQVEVDLVRFGAGDPVVVGTEQQLPPGLVDGLGREPGTDQGGDRGELLAAMQGVLGDSAAPAWCR